MYHSNVLLWLGYLADSHKKLTKEFSYYRKKVGWVFFYGGQIVQEMILVPQGKLV